METTSCFVVVPVKFSASVQHGQHGFERRFFCFLVFVDRDAASVVGDGHRTAILVKLYVNLRRVAVHCFVDAVVDDFPDQVMQARHANAADVHAGAFADGVETLQDGDVLAFVSGWAHEVALIILRLQTLDFSGRKVTVERQDHRTPPRAGR